MSSRVIQGMVIKGEGLGAALGFPTANLSARLIKKYRIPYGVYAARVILNGRLRPGILIAGPTGKIKRGRIKLEVFILNFHQSLYRKIIRVRIIKKIRPIVNFDSLKQLQQQVRRDIKKAKNIVR